MNYDFHYIVYYCLSFIHFNQSIVSAFREQIFDSTNPGNCATLCCGYCQENRIQTHKWEGRCCGTKNDSIDGKCGKY